MDNCTIKLLGIIIVYGLLLVNPIYKTRKKLKYYKNSIRNCKGKNSELINELLRIKEDTGYYLKIVEITKEDSSVFDSDWIKGVTKENGNITIINSKECYQSIVEHIMLDNNG